MESKFYRKSGTLPEIISDFKELEALTNLFLCYNLLLTPFSIFILIMQPTNAYQFYSLASNIPIKNQMDLSLILQIISFFITGVIWIILSLIYVVIVIVNTILALIAGLCGLGLLFASLIKYQRPDDSKTHSEEIKVNNLIESGLDSSPNQIDNKMQSGNIKV